MVKEGDESWVPLLIEDMVDKCICEGWKCWSLSVCENQNVRKDLLRGMLE